MNYTQIKTVEDAFKAMGRDLSKVEENFAWMDESERGFNIISYKLHTVVSAINGGWVADWSDTTQKKWYNWWRFDVSSGFGFSHASYYCGAAYAYVGSRLVFENKEKAEHGAKFFIDLYKEYYLCKCGTSLQVSPKEKVEALLAEDLSDSDYAKILSALGRN